MKTTGETLLCIILLLFLITVGAEDEPVAVQVLFRHGDRETEPNTDMQELGPLTALGKEQMYELGSYVRQRYPNLVRQEFDPAETAFISSDKDRTINSALLVAHGLFKNYNEDANWNENFPIQFQPIPVRRIPKEIDRFIQLSYKCPAHQRLFEQVISEDFAPSFYAEMGEFLEIFSRETNIYDPLNLTLNDIDRLHYIIMFEEQPWYNATHNLPVEDWAQEYLRNDRLVGLKNDYLKFNVKTREMQRLYSGSMLGLLFNTFETPTPRKLTFYAGHDRIVYAIMRTLGVWNEKDRPMPPVASALIFELYGINPNERQYLKIWYRKNSLEPPTLLEIPDCGSECEFLKFQELFGELVPEDFEEECGLPKINS